MAVGWIGPGWIGGHAAGLPEAISSAEPIGDSCDGLAGDAWVDGRGPFPSEQPMMAENKATAITNAPRSDLKRPARGPRYRSGESCD
jgi:hypothetical protein